MGIVYLSLSLYVHYKLIKYVIMRIMLAEAGFKTAQIVRYNTLQRGYVKDSIELTYNDDLKRTTLKALSQQIGLRSDTVK